MIFLFSILSEMKTTGIYSNILPNWCHGVYIRIYCPIDGSRNRNL
jgi:hypothetical protein